ncbi:MAG: hypothetical protein ACXAC7_21890, partial [Candidatus Hodarchaeales archaeon]
FDYLTDFIELNEFDRLGWIWENQLADYGQDLNNNGLFDQLVIEINIYVKFESYYNLEVHIDAFNDIQGYYWSHIGYYWNYTDNVEGNNTILIIVPVRDIIMDLDWDAIFDVEISLYGDDGLIDQIDYQTELYYFDQWDVPPMPAWIEDIADYGVDDDENGLYNYLAFEILLWVNITGSYEVQIALYVSDPNFGFSDYIGYYSELRAFSTIGYNTLVVYVPTGDILNIIGTDEQFFAIIYLYDADDYYEIGESEIYETAEYLYSMWDSPAFHARLVDATFSTIDVHDNDLWDYLEVNISIWFNSTDLFYITVDLYETTNNSWNYIASYSQHYEVIETGLTNIIFNFPVNDLINVITEGAEFGIIVALSEGGTLEPITQEFYFSDYYAYNWDEPDNSGPVLSLNIVADQTIGGVFEIILTSNEQAEGSITIDGTKVKDLEFSAENDFTDYLNLDTTTYSDGAHSFRFAAWDIFDNVQFFVRRIFIDNSDVIIPEVTSNITEGQTLSGKIYIHLEFSEAVTVEIKINEEIFTEFVIIGDCPCEEDIILDTLNYPDGQYTINIKLIDNTGNENTLEMTIEIKNEDEGGSGDSIPGFGIETTLMFILIINLYYFWNRKKR